MVELESNATTYLILPISSYFLLTDQGIYFFLCFRHQQTKLTSISSFPSLWDLRLQCTSQYLALFSSHVRLLGQRSYPSFHLHGSTSGTGYGNYLCLVLSSSFLRLPLFNFMKFHVLSIIASCIYYKF